MPQGFDLKRLERVAELCDWYVETGRLAGAQVQVAYEGKVALRHTSGLGDIKAQTPLSDDALFRIYSMTKPITSIALLQLHEQGRVLMEDPVSRYIPEFADAHVWVGGTAAAPVTRPASTVMTVRHALTHTSGLTYGFFHSHPLDELYRKDNLGDLQTPEISLEEGMKLLASKPLLFEPGTAWNYSLSTDVCGRIVEVISGQSLDEYFNEHILGPLAMSSTRFNVPEEDLGRLATNYARGGEAKLIPVGRQGARLTPEPEFLSGGGGLISSTDDYQRFCDMLLSGGQLDGERVIGRKTLEFMTSNHLPGGKTLNEMGQSTFSESVFEGTGFGLGFSVVVDPAEHGAMTSEGELGWGGAASTTFLVDPVERITAVFMTQFMPSNYYPLRRQLKATVYQALN